MKLLLLAMLIVGMSAEDKAVRSFDDLIMDKQIQSNNPCITIQPPPPICSIANTRLCRLAKHLFRQLVNMAGTKDLYELFQFVEQTWGTPG